MGKAILFDGILERPRHVRLADKIVESLRPIFSRENLITHAPNLIRFSRARKQKTRSGAFQTADNLIVVATALCRRRDAPIAIQGRQRRHSGVATVKTRRFVNRRSLAFVQAVINRFAALAVVLLFVPIAPAREPQS
ncbi:MAG: hypothetical protein WAO00_11695, partial [Chthoniobacterales bacterium]